MTILITAGGTKVPLDAVRTLGNEATGRFGAALAAAFLERGARVILLHAEGTPTPFSATIDLSAELPPQWQQIQAQAAVVAGWRHRFRAITFRFYAEYAAALEHLLRTEPIASVLLSAAVSDFAPRALPGKISSDQQELTLPLDPLPKLIARVKDWRPEVFLVGFKLLDGVPIADLIATAQAARLRHRADLVVANDYQSIRAGNHTIHLVTETGPIATYDSTQQPAQRLADYVLAAVKTGRSSTGDGEVHE